MPATTMTAFRDANLAGRAIKVPRRTSGSVFTIATDSSDSNDDDDAQEKLPGIQTRRIRKASFDKSPTKHQPVVCGQPGVLRLNLDAVRNHQVTGQIRHAHSRSADFQLPLPTDPASTSVTPVILRKKSGELVKPSLKTSSSFICSTFGGLSSEPVTPTSSKSVHFDAHLEQVKLFLSEQKPAAVSRTGSPTTDSETEKEYFRRHGGSPTGENSDDRLDIRLMSGFRPRQALQEVWFEPKSLKLVDENGPHLHGTVVVRNLDFAKSIHVRFTMDNWQTVSEVSARHLASVSLLDGQYASHDRFSFDLRLPGARAGRTLIFAIRYDVLGREYWDNNGGENYHAVFDKKPILQDSKEHGSGLLLALKHFSVADDDMPSPNESPVTPPPVSIRSASLGTRYDFGASLKRPWAAPKLPYSLPTYSHGRNTFTPTKSLNILGSPRDGDQNDMHSNYSLSLSTPMHSARRREHIPRQRGSYFDQWAAPAATARGISPSLHRTSSFPPTSTPSTPPVRSTTLLVVPDMDDTSLLPTPDATSSSSAESSSVQSPADGVPTYSAILDRFCFFTGSLAGLAQLEEDNTAALAVSVSNASVSSTMSSTSSMGTITGYMTPRAGGSPAGSAMGDHFPVFVSVSP